MLLTVFANPNDYASIDVAEQVATDLSQAINNSRESWSERLWERYADWEHLNALNYEVGGFLRKLRQVELNIIYLSNLDRKIEKAEYAFTPVEDLRESIDLEKLIEDETVAYLRNCADEISGLGYECGLSHEEYRAFSDFLTAAADSLSQEYGIDCHNRPPLLGSAA